jgi:hypothetical protein
MNDINENIILTILVISYSIIILSIVLSAIHPRYRFIPTIVDLLQKKKEKASPNITAIPIYTLSAHEELDHAEKGTSPIRLHQSGTHMRGTVFGFLQDLRMKGPIILKERQSMV